jgi:hypothetical protein
MLGASDSWSATIDGAVIKSDSSSNFNIKALSSGVDLNSIHKGKHNIDFSAGYVEFYPFVQFKEGISKKNLKKRYHEIANGNEDFVREGGADGNSLLGYVTLISSDKKSATLSMLAYKGAVNNNITGSDATPKAITNADMYIGDSNVKSIYSDLQAKEINVPFYQAGKGTKLILTFWNDRTKHQSRTMSMSIFPEGHHKAKTVEKKTVDGVNILDMNLWIDGFAPKSSSGIVQITDIKNMGHGQLGKGNPASFISTILQTSKHGGKISIDSWSYAPASGF